MRLTTKSEYGLLAMVGLAISDEGKAVSSRTLAQTRKIPQPFLEQLLVSLRRANLVVSVRGAHGGFALAKSPEDITVLDIVEALDGPLSSGACDVDRGALCEMSSLCVAAPVWAQATEVLRELFSSIPLSELASKQAILSKAIAK